MTDRQNLLTQRLGPKKRQNWLDVLYVFLSVAGVLLFAWLLLRNNGFFPFASDGNTVLMMDARGQYIAYFRDFQHLLKTHGDTIYTTAKALGGDYQSLYAYYLASPFNYLLYFFPDTAVPEFILFTGVAKMALASLNMMLLIRFTFGRTRPLSVGVSFSYAVSSYFFVYLFSPMWLDGPMILPLVALGLIHLVRRKERWLYPLSLGYALLSSWYIGAMICFFSVLFFLTLYFGAGWPKLRQEKARVKVLLHFVLFSLLGGFLGSLGWLVAFSHFSGTKVGFSASSLVWANTLGGFLSGFLTDGYPTPYVLQAWSGYNPTFTSLPTLVLFLLFFLNRKKSARSRISFLLLSLFLSLSLIYNPLYLLWHGMAEPTWFPSRFAFVVDFFVACLAASEAEDFESTHGLDYLLPLLLPAAVLPLAIYLPYSGQHYSVHMSGILLYFGSLALFFLATLVLRLGKKKKKASNVPVAALTCLSVLSLPLFGYSSYLGESQVLSTDSAHHEYSSRKEYDSDEAFQSAVDAVKASDGEIGYRMETTFVRNGTYNNANNNPSYYSYSGLSHFSSTEKKDVQKEMERLGFHYNWFWEEFGSGSTLSAASFLGLKYILAYSDLDVPYLSSTTLRDDVDTEGFELYQNPYALTLGFQASASDVSYVSQGRFLEDGKTIYWFNRFEWLNELYQELVPGLVDESGKPKAIYTILPAASETLSGTTKIVGTDTIERYTVEKKGASLRFDYQIPEDQRNDLLYVDFRYRDSDANVYLDRKLTEMTTYWHSNIAGIPLNSTGKHSVQLYLPSGKEVDAGPLELQPVVALENLEVLKEYTDRLRSHAVKIRKHTSNAVSSSLVGTFESDGSTPYLLYTLPYERGVEVKIDGRKVKTETKFDVFTAASLESIEKGEHEVVWTYTDQGRQLSFLMTLLSLAGLVLSNLLIARSERKHKTD